MQMFSLWYGSYTSQRKLLPGSCAELNNIVRISVTKFASFPPPQKKKKLGETSMRTRVNTQLPDPTDNSKRLEQQLH